MVKRKIMSLGRSSLVVSLPKNWTELNGLKKGDAVSCAIQRDRSLVISLGGTKKRRHSDATIDVDSNEDASVLIRRIIGNYLNGYYGIRLVSKSILTVPQRKAIRDIAGKLYMRIMESDSKSMYLVTLIDESEASLPSTIERMQTICLSMCVDSLKSLKSEDIKLAKSVFSEDDEVDHFAFFTLRLLRLAALDTTLAKQLEIDLLDCVDFQTLVYLIERTADLAADIARCVVLLAGNQQRISEEILTLMVNAGVEAVDLYEQAVQAFLSEDFPFSSEILNQQKRIKKLDQEIASRSFRSLGAQSSLERVAQLVCLICSIRDDIQRIAECGAEVAELGINRAFKTAP